MNNKMKSNEKVVKKKSVFTGFFLLKIRRYKVI